MNRLGAAVPPALARVIRAEAFRAGRRLRRYGLDLDDVHQEMLLHWVRRRPRHDPRLSSAATYCSHICRHRGLQLLEGAAARKRGGGITVVSLSDEVGLGATGEMVERSCTVSEDRCAILLGRRSRPAAELHDLAIDTHRVLRELPAHLQALARLLAEDMSIGEMTETLGVSRATVYRRIGALRKALFEAGLANYLGAERRRELIP